MVTRYTGLGDHLWITKGGEYMSQVSNGFITPVQGVSQTDPINRPEIFLQEQINLISDINKGVYRRPGVRHQNTFEDVDKQLTKILEYQQEILSIYLYIPSGTGTWNYKISNESLSINYSGTISDPSIVAYLDSLEDPKDLQVKIHKDHLLFISTKKLLNIDTETSSVIIQFHQELDQLAGDSGSFEVTIGADEASLSTLTVNPAITSSNTDQVLYEYLTEFKSVLGSYIDSIYFDETYASLMITLNAGTVLTNIRYLEDNTNSNPLEVDSLVVRENDFSISGDGFPLQYDLSNDRFLRLVIDLGDTHIYKSFIRDYLDGSPIKDLTVYQDRLIFITEKGLVGSHLNRYTKFGLRDDNELQVTDPIFLTVAEPGDTLVSILPLSNGLIIYGENTQYQVAQNGQINPTSGVFVTTHYSLGGARPIVTPSQVFFGASNGDYTQIYTTPLQNPQAFELTKNVPRYIPQEITKLGYIESQKTLIVHSSGARDTLYVLTQETNGNEQVQSAWHKWTFHYDIEEFYTFNRGLIYIVFRDGTNRYVGTLSWGDLDVDFYFDLWASTEQGGTVTSRAYVKWDGDSWVEGSSSDYTYTGIPFESSITLSPWILKDQTGRPQLEGKLKLLDIVLTFSDTWYLKFIQEAIGRETLVREYQNLELDGRTNLGLINNFDVMDGVQEAKGVLQHYLGGNSNNTRITITSGDSLWGMGIVGYSLYGNWQPYNKWSQGSRV